MVALRLTFIAALLATRVAAEMGAQGELAVWSSYLFRGVPYTDGWVAQPALSLSLNRDWTVTTWMNVDLSDANGAAGHPTETDVTVQWLPDEATALRPFLGLATYVVSVPSEAAGTTAELLAGLRAQPPERGAARWLPALEVSLWYEVLDYDDLYVGMAVERGISLDSVAEVTLRAAVGWAGREYHQFFFATDHAGWSDLSVTAELGRSLGTRAHVSLMAQYQTLLDAQLRSASQSRHGEAAWWLWGSKGSWTF